MVKVARIAEDGRVLAMVELEDDAALALDEVEVHGVEMDLARLVGRYRWTGEKFDELPFKALVLDAADVLIDVVELASSAELTAQHVDLRPLGGECDREPGQYRWDREKQTLVPLKKAAQRPAEVGGVSLEAAIAAYLKDVEQRGAKLPKATRAWLEQFDGSIDNKKGAR